MPTACPSGGFTPQKRNTEMKKLLIISIVAAAIIQATGVSAAPPSGLCAATSPGKDHERCLQDAMEALKEPLPNKRLLTKEELHNIECNFGIGRCARRLGSGRWEF
jgi:hypothetical protein